MEKDQHFDTLQDFKNALENWSVDAKFRYWVKKATSMPTLHQNCGCDHGSGGQHKRFRQQAAGVGDIADRIQHCSGCRKTGNNIGAFREPPELPVIGP
jgi:hypothetical protein